MIKVQLIHHTKQKKTKTMKITIIWLNFGPFELLKIHKNWAIKMKFLENVENFKPLKVLSAVFQSESI